MDRLLRGMVTELETTKRIAEIAMDAGKDPVPEVIAGDAFVTEGRLSVQGR